MNSSLKTCFKCATAKPLEDFYKHPAMGDGHLGKCKACTKADTLIRRIGNSDRVREYDRVRSRLPHRIELRRKAMLRQTPQRKAARQEALRCSPIARPCVICGALPVERHHPDYDKPKQVVFLCVPHHRQLHAGRFSVLLDKILN